MEHALFKVLAETLRPQLAAQPRGQRALRRTTKEEPEWAAFWARLKAPGGPLETYMALHAQRVLDAKVEALAALLGMAPRLPLVPVPHRIPTAAIALQLERDAVTLRTAFSHVLYRCELMVFRDTITDALQGVYKHEHGPCGTVNVKEGAEGAATASRFMDRARAILNGTEDPQRVAAELWGEAAVSVLLQ
jgi:hypothetical protein